MKKVIWLKLTRIDNLAAMRENMRRFHWRRWFETKETWHKQQAEYLEERIRETEAAAG